MIRSLIVLFAAIVSLPTVSGCMLQNAESGEARRTSSRREFEGWGAPKAVLFITGRQYGYIEPCGCTGLDNQKGGLARRHTLLESLRAKGWPVVALDAGNQVRRIGVQAEAKFQSTIDALRKMKYSAATFGPDDLRLQIGEVIVALLEGADENGQSDLFICANANPIGFVGSHRVIEAGGVRVGVTSVLGTKHLERVTEEDILTQPPMDGLRQSMAELKRKNCDVVVLLSHASLDESREFARAFPDLDLVVTTGGSGEPTYKPEQVRGAQAVMVQAGTKGMYAGVVGIFDGPEQLKYQRVALDARFKDSREMLDLLATYQTKLKEQGLEGLGLDPKPHIGGAFIGSKSCAECHEAEYDIWLDSPHHHATDSIVNPGERSEIPRHFDPECISCHVTGWNPQQYFPYKTGYVDLTSKAMHGSGCENCHGPGKNHVLAERGDLANLTPEKIQQYREGVRLEMGKAAHAKCLECHDLDNSPDFHQPGAFEEFWDQIAH